MIRVGGKVMITSRVGRGKVMIRVGGKVVIRVGGKVMCQIPCIFYYIFY